MLRKLISSSKTLNGVYRAIVIEGEEDMSPGSTSTTTSTIETESGTETQTENSQEENNKVENSAETPSNETATPEQTPTPPVAEPLNTKCARVYIPALHRTQMPFKLGAEGSIEGTIFESSAVSTIPAEPTTNETAGEVVETDTTVTSDTSNIYMKKNDYPLAQICSWSVCPKLKMGDQTWVMFENGDAEFPVVIGSLGAILPDIESLKTSAMSGVAGVGRSVDIPDDLGLYITYMGQHMITSPSSEQYQLLQDAKNTGRYKAGEIYGINNMAIIDGRMGIALVENVGGQLGNGVGDYIDVTFADGDVWNCIQLDVKHQGAPVEWDPNPANEWGHENGKVVLEIVSHNYSPPPSYDPNKKVTRLTVVGNYYTGLYSSGSYGITIDLDGIQIKQNLTTVNSSSRNGNSIQYIVIHYTANDGDTAAGNLEYFKSVDRQASAHYFVDENEVGQCVTDDLKAWHCGGSVESSHHPYLNKCTNSNSIGIEMCSRKYSNGTYYFKPEVVSNTASLTKALMNKYNIPVSNVIRHYDVTGKICPAPFVNSDSEWQNFLNSLK